MKKTLVWLLLTVLLVSLFPIALADGAYATGECICLGVSLRVEPKTNAKKIRTINNGETFTILEANGDWYRVSHKNTEGWLLADYVIEEPEHLYTRKNNIPARAWASKSSKRVGLIGDNERLTVIRELDSYWIVSYRNAMCYVSKDASVWLDSQVASARGKFTVEVTQKTTLRTGASKSWAKIRDAKVGESFMVVAEEGDWYKVFCDGYFAYVQKNVTEMVYG